MNKRFSHGLLLNANYTLSKSEDTGQNSTTFISNFATMVDPFNNEAERGPSAFDRRHRGVVSFHYAPDFLWGFQFGGTGTFESGLPLNPTISINSGALNGTGATQHRYGQWHRCVQPRAVRGAERLSPDGPQDDRWPPHQVVQPWRQPPAGGAVGSVQHVQLDQLHGLRHHEVPRDQFHLRRGHQQGRCEPVEDPGFAVPTLASNTLFGPRDMQIGFKFLW